MVEVEAEILKIESQLLEYINQKRYTLEEYKAGNPRVSKSLMRILENELHELEWALASKDASIKKVLLDKCAGQ
jgi:hypothetical protein